MQSYRDQLIHFKPDLLLVTEVHRPGLVNPPEPNFIELKEFLDKNDCTKLTKVINKDRCYQETRLKLIKANDKLDKVELDNFLLNRSIDRLQNSISKIIDDFPITEAVELKK